MASESESNFISVKGPALLSKYVGESERAVREMFHKARQAAPCIIFFDEIDALVPTRGMGGSATRSVAIGCSASFWRNWTESKSSRECWCWGRPTAPTCLDPAVLRPGRFEEIITFALPEEEDRKAILAVHLRGKPLAARLTVEELARRTEGLSGAQLAALCNRAALCAVRRAVAATAGDSAAPVTVAIVDADLEAALQGQPEMGL